MKLKELPEKLSDCLIEAIDDLQASVLDGIAIAMHDWHVRGTDLQIIRNGEIVNSSRKCAVCLAGAKMRGMGVPDGVTCTPSDFDNATRDKFYALDALRLGLIEAAFEYMGREKPASLPNDVKPIVQYDAENPEPFYAYVLGVAALLKEAGE